MKDQNFELLKNIYPNKIFISSKSEILMLEDYSTNILDDFLCTLKDHKDYVMIIEYIYSKRYCHIDDPKILLSGPIIVSNKVNPDLISKFIEERINRVFKALHIDPKFSNRWGSVDGPAIRLDYSEFSLLSELKPIKFLNSLK